MCVVLLGAQGHIPVVTTVYSYIVIIYIGLVGYTVLA